MAARRFSRHPPRAGCTQSSWPPPLPPRVRVTGTDGGGRRAGGPWGSWARPRPPGRTSPQAELLVPRRTGGAGPSGGGGGRHARARAPGGGGQDPPLQGALPCGADLQQQLPALPRERVAGSRTRLPAPGAARLLLCCLSSGRACSRAR